MLLPDVNVLLYAHREDSHREHSRYAAWVTALATGRSAEELEPGGPAARELADFWAFIDRFAFSERPAAKSA